MTNLTPELAKYAALDKMLDECLLSSRHSSTINIQELVDRILNDPEFSNTVKEFNDGREQI